jgi:Flp pilus assembly protein TadB
MSVTAAIIAGAATAAAAGTNAIAQGKLNRKNRRWQEKMYNKQVADRRADAEAQAQRQKDLAEWAYAKFDSPAAQRAAYAAAGVNPFVCISITSAIQFLDIGVMLVLQRMKSSAVMIALFRLFFGLLFSKSIEVIHLFNNNRFIVLYYGHDVFNPP